MMVTQTLKMNTSQNVREISDERDQEPGIGICQNLNEYYLFQGMLEGFIDGILILTEQGELVHANQTARQICHQITQIDSPHNSVPEKIWEVCESLIESRDLFPNQKIVLESEISQANSVNLRLRVQWFKLERMRRDCILVTIEDKYQSLQKMVTNDIHQYDLTPREAEVWLLYRAKYSYKEIAEQLYITLNTVKKHMKNIHAKRKAFSEDED